MHNGYMGRAVAELVVGHWWLLAQWGLCFEKKKNEGANMQKQCERSKNEQNIIPKASPTEVNSDIMSQDHLELLVSEGQA